MNGIERELFESKLQIAELKIVHLKEIFDLHVECAEVALKLAKVEAERQVERLKGWFFAVMAVIGLIVSAANYFKH